MKVKCHFVYSVPIYQDQSFVARLERRVRSILNNRGIPVGLLSNRQPTTDDLKSWPVQSPSENTRNIYCALARKAPTILYHLTERVHCRFQPDDIFLGHPYFPHTEGGYGVTEMALKETIRPRKVALITPLHCDVKIKTDHINKEFLDDVDRMLPSADVLFGIMGEYWWNQWDLSPYAHWKSKMIRLDMAVDAQRYPRIKKSFNQAGKRGYLYIGNSSDPRKGVDFLSRLMSQFDDYPKGWIGSGPDIPNVPRISDRHQLTPEFMAEVGKQYDIFISPSIADPNPTTILESMAWGFPVVCTPQSGYYETDYRKNIFLDDIVKSVNVLNELQYTDEQKLMLMADKAREAVVADYNWDKFTATVIQNLGI
jgi:glycosyltransferase involved in cell wall biosynthesis